MSTPADGPVKKMLHCSQCGWEIPEGKVYNEVCGDVKAKHDGTHVCDRFEFGYFLYEGEKIGIHR